MVLYHVSTTYQLLYCITHRLARHPREGAGLLLVEYIFPEARRKETVQRLLDTGWFSFVRLVPENQFKLRRGNSLTESSSPQEIEGVIRNICACVQGWLGMDVKQFSPIYIGSDQWSFGIYCLANQIPHVYIEDASGMLSQRERYMKITREISLTNYVISQYLHGAGTSEYETARLCDMRNFVPGFTDEKAVNFSIYDALKEEIPQKVPEILDFYGAKPVTVPQGRPVCMYMTQYLKSMAVKDLDVQEQITNLLVDYFAQGFQLVIKPHPKDQWLNYRRMFPEAVLLPPNINSELIPFLFDQPVQRVLTASSTSVGGMAPFAREVFQFTTEIETRFEHLHAVYLAAVLLGEAAKAWGPLHLSLQKVNAVQLENFLRILEVRQMETGAPVLVTGGAPPEAPGGAVLWIAGERSSGKSPVLPRAGQALELRGTLLPEEGSLLTENGFLLYLTAPCPGMLSQLPPLDFVRELPFSRAKLQIQSKLLTEEEIEAKNHEEREIL